MVEGKLFSIKSAHQSIDCPPAHTCFLSLQGTWMIFSAKLHFQTVQVWWDKMYALSKMGLVHGTFAIVSQSWNHEGLILSLLVIPETEWEIKQFWNLLQEISLCDIRLKCVWICFIKARFWNWQRTTKEFSLVGIYGSKHTIGSICEPTQEKQLGCAWTLLWIEFKPGDWWASAYSFWLSGLLSVVWEADQRYQCRLLCFLLKVSLTHSPSLSGVFLANVN